MIRFYKHVLVVAFAVATHLASAQSLNIQRIGILPFESDDQTLALAVPVAVARAIENIDAVVAPPPLELGIYLRKFPLRKDKLKEFYALQALVTGEVSGKDGAWLLKLKIDATKDQNLEVKATDFKKLVMAADDALLKALSIKPTAADEKEISAVEAALPSAGVVVASSNLSDLDNLDELAKNDSPWSLAVRGFLASQSTSQNNKTKDGINLTTQAAKAAPQDVFVQTLHGFVTLMSGNTVEAKTILNTALKLNPVKPEALYAQGVASLRSGNNKTSFENAANFFGKALTANPRLSDAAVALADILERFEQSQNAINVLTRTMQVAPENLALHQQMLALVGRNDPDLANKYLEEVIKKFPDVPENIYALALRLPDTSIAEKILNQGEERYKDSSLLALTRGKLFERRAQYMDAAKAFASALERDPKNTNAGISEAAALAKLGKLSDAQKVLFSAIGKEDMRSLADVYIQAGRTTEAKTAMSGIKEDTPETNFLNGIIALREWRFDDAENLLKKAGARGRSTLADVFEQRSLGAAKLSPDDLIKYRLALSAIDAGSNFEAITVVQQALIGNAKNPHLNFVLGVALFAANQKDDAVDALKIALAGLPNNAVVLANLGAAYMDVGRFDLATETLQQATKLAPKYGRAWLYLGLLEFQLSHAAPAKEALQRAISLDDDLKILAQPYLNALGVK